MAEFRFIGVVTMPDDDPPPSADEITEAIQDYCGGETKVDIESFEAVTD